MLEFNTTHLGDCRKLMLQIDDDSIPLIITSPPYWQMRDYGSDLGRERDPRDYVGNIVDITNSFHRILKDDGSVYINLGDVYFGTKGFHRTYIDKHKRKPQKHYASHNPCKPDGRYLQDKTTLMLPERIAIGMQNNGWILRNKIVWIKTNPYPNCARDRVMPSYEFIYHFVKKPKYYYNAKMAKDLGHIRDIITTPVHSQKDHDSAFPQDLIYKLIAVSSRDHDVVLDPFMGSATTAEVALRLGRSFIGIEASEAYAELANDRVRDTLIQHEKDMAEAYENEAALAHKCNRDDDDPIEAMHKIGDDW